MRHAPAAAVLAALTMGASASSAGDVSIVPSLIEVNVGPGQDYTTLVEIVYAKADDDDTTPLRIVLGTEDWDMDVHGRLSYTRPDTLPASAASWIVFSPGEAELAPGQTMFARLSIIVPQDARGGEYRAALVAQPRAPYRPLAENEKRLEFRYRLASTIYVSVPPVDRALDLEALDVVLESGRWVVCPTFRNDGGEHARVTDTFAVLPVEDHLLGTTYVKPRDEAGVVLPGRRRQFRHWLPDNLGPDAYRIVYEADAGPHLPLIVGETTFELRLEDMPVVATTE